ncbi:MAG: hypothetical protein HRT88_21375, partial [Lentisphaeraceae bacterium]|nr:hypothetical protein [Lentisphaeraceae bacterium]
MFLPKIHINLSLFFLLCLSLSGQGKQISLGLKDGDTIALVGATFIEREAERSFIETYLTLAEADKDLKFRNFGWSGDNVKGESRSFRGYGVMLKQVAVVKPSLIVLAYGANESWQGEAGLARFIKNYGKLIDDLKKMTSARFVLMTSLKQEAMGGHYPDPQAHNKNQANYFAAVKKMALQKKLPFIDLFNEIQQLKGLTSNSIHLNDKGYERVAQALSHFEALPNSTMLINALSKKGKSSHGQLGRIKKMGNGLSFLCKPKKLGPFTSRRMLKISGLARGNYQVMVDGKVILKASAAKLAAGIESSELLFQEKRIQQIITEKNQLFFHSWRPQNSTYLLGFRKKEQGKHSKELDEFLALIEVKEAQIKSLKKVRAYTWKITRVKKTATQKKKLITDNEFVLNPQEEAAGFSLPKDLQVSLFAAEPMLVNPTNMNWDSQGRLWVACAPNYPQIKPGHLASDQIVVLEDTDNDGKADKSTVFVDDILIPTGVLAGNGGVYVATSTELVHYKDLDGDLKADVRKVIFSGFGTEDTHHIVHTPYWGQDGLLYFNQSLYINSHIETPYGVKRLLRGGIWQYNPNTEELKIFSRGMINPWGHKMDKFGQSFATDGAYREGINY